MAAMHMRSPRIKPCVQGKKERSAILHVGLPAIKPKYGILLILNWRSFMFIKPVCEDRAFGIYVTNAVKRHQTLHAGETRVPIHVRLLPSNPVYGEERLGNH